MDQRTKKLVLMYKILYLKDDADYICQKNEEGDSPVLIGLRCLVFIAYQPL